jgi:hypothetical protein
MQTFVVRVYRSGQPDSPEADPLRGVVEEVATGQQATFRSCTELLSILVPAPSTVNQSGQPTSLSDERSVS